MNIDANVGGNHQCLSFYQHDIVCSLEANCLRKMGFSSFSILPEGNHRTKAGLFLELSSQSINNQVSKSEGPPKQTHHGPGNGNLIILVRLVWGRISVCPRFISSWYAVIHSFALARDNSQLLECKHFISFIEMRTSGTRNSTGFIASCMVMVTG